MNVLCFGQSNALGHNVGGAPSYACDDCVRVWNNVNPPPGSAGAAFVAPQFGDAPFDAAGYNNAAAETTI